MVTPQAAHISGALGAAIHDLARLVKSLMLVSLVTALLGCSAQNGGNAVFGTRYLEIPVSDIERAVDFYEFVFGVELGRVVEDGCDFPLRCS
jgi:hypothetical protein